SMTTRSTENLKIVCISIFLTGLTSVGFVYAFQTPSLQRRHARGFTIVTKETIRMNDPNMQARAGQADYIITTRYQRSDGSWKEEMASYKGENQLLRKSVGFGIPGRGVFHIDSNRAVLDFVSAMPTKEITSYVTVTNGHNH